MPRASELIDTALAHHRAGRLDEAARLYRAVLADEADHAEALHLLGLVEIAAGRPEAAVPLLRRAVALAPDAAVYHSNLAEALRQAGRPAEVVEALHRLYLIEPNSAAVRRRLGDALATLGLAEAALESYATAAMLDHRDPGCRLAAGALLRSQGRWDEAIAWYRQAVDCAPDDIAARNDLGALLEWTGQLDAAAEQLQAAIDRAPGHAAAQFNLGHVLLRLGRTDAAIVALTAAAALDPGLAEARRRLAQALMAAGRPEEAAAACLAAIELEPRVAAGYGLLGEVRVAQDRTAEAVDWLASAVRLAPADAAARYNLANALVDLGRLDEAVAEYRAVQDLSPGHAAAACNLAGVLLQQRRPAEAIAAADAAIRIEPGRAEAHCNRAYAALLAGDLRPGWEDYEWRWRVPGMPSSGWRFAQPQWRAGSLAGARILIHAEQGLGDTLQFARYVPMVAALGAEVVFEVQAPLKPLFEGRPAYGHVIAAGQPQPPFDWHSPLLSLPRAFGTDLASVPAAVPYVAPPADRTAAWGERLAQALGRQRPRVGIVWAGNSWRHERRQQRIAARRAMDLDRFAPLLAVPGVRFVSLQKQDLAGLAAFPQVLNLGPALADFADTAAVMAHLDLVVSVDTSVPHLAGALGRPVWLLACHDACWRWLMDRADSPWYPTMRIFRQPAPGDWDSVVAEATHALAAWAAR